MSLSPHILAIKQYHLLLLQDVTTNDQVKNQVIEMLLHMQDHHNDFDLTLCAQTPFYKEFIQTIEGHCTSIDTCFALLECIILFCREKQLRLDQKNNLWPIEQELLKFYEESDLWDIEDGTLLHAWYWHHLPSQYQN